MARAASSMFTAELLAPAIRDSFVKLNPRTLVRNPVMFVTAVVALLVTVMLATGIGGGTVGFKGQLVFWLWLTVIFGNFAEALAEGRGKAQAASLRATKGELTGKLITAKGIENVAATTLKVGDIVFVDNGDLIPADGEVIEGVASVNEAAITGESAPVIREGGGDRSAVTAGTRVVSDSLKVRVTAGPGQGFLDRMIALVEGAERQKTPNEIALTILLVGLTIIFLIAVGTIPMFASYAGGVVPIVVLSALLITPDPDDDRGAAVGDRHRGHGPPGAFQRARQIGPRGRGGGRHRRAAARQDRHDHHRRPPGERVPSGGGRVPGRTRRGGAAGEPRRRNAGGPLDRRAGTRQIRREDGALPDGAEIIPFTAQTRISGVKFGATLIQKGAVDSILRANPHRAKVPRRPTCAARPRRSRAPAVRRWRSPRTASCSARSTSRTSSRRAFASASASCARWASAR